MVRYFYSQLVTLLLYGKKVIHVTGLRRSGNHACIYWLANAIEQKRMQLDKFPENKHLYKSETGKVTFINNIYEVYSPYYYLWVLIKKLPLLRKCDYVILSSEDLPADFFHYRVPAHACNIYCSRSVLNLFSSRWKMFTEQAISKRPLVTIDKSVIDIMLSYSASTKYIEWNYDDWLSISSYRKEFLENIGLSVDLMPEEAHQGGGSSFSSKSNFIERSERYKQVVLPLFIKQILLKDEYSYLLKDSERKYLLDNERNFI